MKDKALAYIRTIAPIIAGSILAWLATRGLDLNDLTELVTITITAFLQIVYYILARLIGKKFPKIEALLLGSSKTPQYED